MLALNVYIETIQAFTGGRCKNRCNASFSAFLITTHITERSDVHDSQGHLNGDQCVITPNSKKNQESPPYLQ